MPLFRQTIIRDNLERRARIIDGVRTFFRDAGFLEVETPVRIPAPLPEAHIDTQPAGDWYLQPSPELTMKRLLAAGYPRIFQICRCFRQGERGSRHLPEMTLLEWYASQADYQTLMQQCEELVAFLVRCLRKGHSADNWLTFQSQIVDLTPPWDRLSVTDAFHRFGRMTVADALERDCFDEVMGIDIEPQLGLDRPVFLIDYPAQCGSLARRKADDPSVVERFELYIAGMELCNAFSELADPVEQRERFEAENRLREAAGKTVYPAAEPFLSALVHMPPAAGIALGIDRLVMLLLDAGGIDEVVAFTPEEL
ncbi:MAG: EF-P lysine aminoacylase GenX [Deltaproteobacteria bacterium]|nr:MAG: EF-P lysine aminoacylase GenX [Deltaproteobacteria bacterium]